MALDFGARLVTDPSIGPTTAMRDVLETVCRWARVEGPLIDGDQASKRPNTSVHCETFGDIESDEWAWALRLTNPDRNDPAIIWSVQVVAHRLTQVEVTVRLDRVRTDGSLARRIEDPAPPKCLTDLLEHPRLRFSDGGRQLDTGVWVLDRDNAADLASLVLDPDRRLPIFGFTPRDEDPIDGGILVPKVLGIAHVALIKSSASWELDALLPRGLNVYGGAARLWWPGVNVRSRRFDHQLWTASVPAAELSGKAADAIIEAARTATIASPRVADLQRAKRDERTRALVRELEDLRRRADSASTAVSSPDAAPLLDPSPLEVRDATDRLVRQLQEDVEAALALAQEREQRAVEALERASLAERYRDQLRAELADLRRNASGHVNEDEDEAALRQEIEAELAAYGDVDGARPRVFSFGASFALSVEVLGPRYRAKVVKACADVASGSPQLLSRREDHPLRVGLGASDDQVMRERDGAAARRCYVESHTASARRLHYWHLSETVEFASVNVHDDMTIPR